MHARLELSRKRFVDHPVTLDKRLAGKGLSHDIYAEMALALRVSTGMAGMQRGFVDDGEPLRRERLLELARKCLSHRPERHALLPSSGDIIIPRNETRLKIFRQGQGEARRRAAHARQTAALRMAGLPEARPSPRPQG